MRLLAPVRTGKELLGLFGAVVVVDWPNGVNYVPGRAAYAHCTTYQTVRLQR